MALAHNAKLESALDITPPKEKTDDSEIIEAEVTVIDVPGEVSLSKDDKQIESDFQEAREQLKELYYQTQQAIGSLITVAEQSESARDFEVVGQLLKTAAEINDRILGVYKQRNELQNTNGKGSSTNIEKQQNVIFAGSTHELLELVKESKQKLVESTHKNDGWKE